MNFEAVAPIHEPHTHAQLNFKKEKLKEKTMKLLIHNTYENKNKDNTLLEALILNKGKQMEIELVQKEKSFEWKVEKQVYNFWAMLFLQRSKHMT